MNEGLMSLGRGLCLGKAKAGTRKQEVPESPVSQFLELSHNPPALPFSPIVPVSHLLPVPRPLGRFEEEGLPARWSWGEGEVLGRGTRLWLELQQLLTLRSKKGRG